MAVISIAVMLTGQPSARAADDPLADTVMGLYQGASGPIASRKPVSSCGRIASCLPVNGQVRQSFKLAANLAMASESDSAAELAACEDLAKIMQPQTRGHCQQIAERADATPRQRARALTRLAYISEREGKFDDYMALLAKAQSADPSFLKPRLVQANYLILGNKSGDALDILKAVLKIDPQNAEAYVGIGRVHMIMGQLRQAYAEISKGIDLGFSGPEAYYYRGFVLEEADRFLDAAEDYTRALARYDPMHMTPELISFGDPLQRLAFVLARADRPAPIIKILAGVEKRRLPNFQKSDLLAQRAEANEKIGRFADAAKDMAAAARLAAPEKRAALYVRQSVMLQRAGRNDEATKKMTEALDGADLRTVLRVQVFLRDHGYVDVEITGKMDPVTHKAAVSCFAKPECGSGISHFI